ncbi:hypothetical protein COLO4_27465 [Corchorus olitorius]|uniref:Uncharacterized protein n=1 Tax=Corchorus olitorius TaxID=93759 RepID=A0A1R3HR55_9ROSI|nr:hypothetical protein COLO4_27465 [Corchorus olitorius]
MVKGGAGSLDRKGEVGRRRERRREWWHRVKGNPPMAPLKLRPRRQKNGVAVLVRKWEDKVLGPKG